MAAVALLERAGYDVVCPKLACCGRPAISQGLLLEARESAEQNIRRLAPAAARGASIVGTEPSCVSALLDEYPRLVRSPLAELVASRTFMIETFLRRELERDGSALSRSIAAGHCSSEEHGDLVLYHGHCHQKALVGSADAMAVLRAFFGDGVQEINSGCCGMAGSFGHEVEHYEIARAMGEHRLFPAIRSQVGGKVAVSGFSCRQQIEHHTSAKPVHLVELLAAVISERA
jgi:Fe-S oxidoreductase